METHKRQISGTHIWYYFICKRQVWLISHEITPDQENTNIKIGKHVENEHYKREKKYLFVNHNIIDVFRLSPTYKELKL